MTAGAATGVLHVEHELLGAEFERRRCTGEPPWRLRRGVRRRLARCSPTSPGATYLLASGADARRFAGPRSPGGALRVGEAACEAALTGTGASSPSRCSCERATASTSSSTRVDAAGALAAWLELLAHAALGGGRAAFPDLLLEDASGMLVPLLLAGPAAARGARRLRPATAPSPRRGASSSCSLDAITAVVARPAAPFAPSAYLVLVPVGAARILWRSLLSFTEVTPVGHRALRPCSLERMPWRAPLADGAPAERAPSLRAGGSSATDQTFVGARSLG